MSLLKGYLVKMIIACASIFFATSIFAIDIDAVPNVCTTCPPGVFENCTSDIYFGDIQLDLQFYNVPNNEILFRVRKYDLSNFSQGGTPYLKEHCI